MPSTSFFQNDNSLQLPATAYFTTINDDALNNPNKSQNLIQKEPSINDYIKYNKNLTFSYHPYLYKFQQGPLGEQDSYLIGILNLNLSSITAIKTTKESIINCVYLKFKGREKVKWVIRDGPRSKKGFGGEHILCDVGYKIWESSSNENTSLMELLSQTCGKDLTNEINGTNDLMRIPFKVKLPYNLPDSIESEFGNVEYTLKAMITTSINVGNGISTTSGTFLSTIFKQRFTSEIKIPLKHTLILNHDKNPPYIIHGENIINLYNNNSSYYDSKNRIATATTVPPMLNCTLVLPPNKNINIGIYISIPIRIRIIEPGISLEMVEIMLKSSKDFRSSNGESKHVKEISSKIIIPRKNINFINSRNNLKKNPFAVKSSRVDGECIQNINFYIPTYTLPTYNGRYITISHQLLLKCGLSYTNHKGVISKLNDFVIEEHINIYNIHKNFDIQLPNVPLPPKFFNPKQFFTTKLTSIDSLHVIPTSNFNSNDSKGSILQSSDSSDSSNDDIDSLYYYSRPASSLFSLHSINSTSNDGISRLLSTRK
ncbi:4324_t:CDS:1 [Funneliformis geosporum]|uniref:12648_t:CDS:1 n=1 Tax=Funneliformis geosporum TaxID=1117311 RepID=A0A9W4X0B7_9GLOM|nr:4324_t:CDS:1 [Funneliformis geosporum]CAI2185746.1 12648_t:CDS:1 [Funneliformis geosporum]